MCLGGGSGGDNGASAARAEEAARQARIKEGTDSINNAFGAFNDDYFAKQGSAYLDYYSPQLTQQYEDARKDLTMALARSGILESSAGAKKLGDLSERYAENQALLSDKARSTVASSKADVEQNRSDLITQLSATGDATAATNSAIARAAALSTPATYSPLASMFADLVDNYVMRSNAARQGYDDANGLFSIGTGSARTIQ